MSVWSTTTTVKGKKYDHSNVDPRKKAEPDEMELAMVADFVYDDKGEGYSALPYLRVSVGQDSIILTERGAKELWAGLETFMGMRKWRKR